MKNLLTPIRFACVLALGGVAAALAGAEQPEGETVEFPPFVITGIASGPAWRYAGIPGFEILSQCPDTETREIVAALWRGPQLVLPPSLRPHFSLPITVVLFDQAPSQAGDPTSFGSERHPGEIQAHWINLIKRTLEDRESFSLNLWPGSFTYSSTFRFHTSALLRRAPAAPAWLNAGMFGGYGLYREGIYWHPGDKEKVVHIGMWHSAAELRPIQGLPPGSRISPQLLKQAEQWKRLVKAQLAGPRPLKPSPLLAFLPELPALFERAPPAANDPAGPRWACAAALFVRWGIYGGTPAQAEQFWRFTERACTEPVTEALFRECFGRSYADVQAELSWYLPVALTEEARAPVEGMLPMPALQLRDATSVEIARLRGEWERMEAEALAPKFPDLAKDYREQAVSAFNRAYKDGSRDPRLLASMGLLALDSQEFTLAAQYLELAVAGHVAGPRPYLETARLHWAAGRLDDQGALPPGVLTGVINLLLAAEQQGPPMGSVYLLLATALTQSGSCTPEQAAALQRGLKFFPRQPDVQERINAALHPTPASQP